MCETIVPTRSERALRWTALSLVFVAAACVSAADEYSMVQLEGAWWPAEDSPTAAFAIQGGEIWLDIDAEYRPARVAGDTLVYDLGPDIGVIQRHIVSLVGDTLILRTVGPGEPRNATYVRR